MPFFLFLSCSVFSSLHFTSLPFALFSLSLCFHLPLKNIFPSVFFSFFFIFLVWFSFFLPRVPPSEIIFLISGSFGHEGVKEELGLPSSLALWGLQPHLAGADLGLVQSEGVGGCGPPLALAQGFRSTQARGGACCTPTTPLLPEVGNNAPMSLGLWLSCPLLVWLAPSQVNPFHQGFRAELQCLGKKVLALA